MANKKILYVYIAAFIMIMVASILCIPQSVTVFNGVCALILLCMMLALEYIAFGMGKRLFMDIVLLLGLGIGIIIGLNNNPNMNTIISNITLASFTILVLASTYRVLKNPLK